MNPWTEEDQNKLDAAERILRSLQIDRTNRKSEMSEALRKAIKQAVDYSSDADMNERQIEELAEFLRDHGRPIADVLRVIYPANLAPRMER